MNAHRVYMGFDSRESAAYEVAGHSLFARASRPVSLTAVRLDRCTLPGLLSRPTFTFENVIWDAISEAPQSTEFAIARFLVPLLAQHGFALFVDSDVVFLGDVAELFALADPALALQVVPHVHVSGAREKKDAQAQTYYARKNWSSVMLFNCDHPAHRALTLKLINEVPGRDLHRFCWLLDSEIGRLPAEWNWLVGVEPKPAAPKLAHFTLGGPWLPDWKGAEHDSLWLDAEAHSRSDG